MIRQVVGKPQDPRCGMVGRVRRPGSTGQASLWLLAVCTAGLFTDYLGGVLVLPQPEKHWLTKPIVAGPFRKFHLANDVRLDPAAASHLRSRDRLAVSRTAS